MTERTQSALQKTAPAHAVSADEVLSRLEVLQKTGLSDAEVKRRLKRYGPNALSQKPPANPLLILLSQFNSPVVFLLIGAALFGLAFGERVEFVAIMIVLVVNAAIGFFTEVRAVRSMEALRELTAPTALVRRAGRPRMVAAESLVPGDVVLVEAGDMIAADMRLIASANLAADESALTGESLPARKGLDPVAADADLGDRHPMLFKGCALTRGTGEAVVTGTGMQTELGRITKLVSEAEPSRSPLERQLDVLSRHLIWVTLLIAAMVAAAGILAGRDLVLMVESAVALAVAAIPEGLPIVATLALARGMLRMARRNALIEQLSAVETLGATTVILTDKTGTLTENRMHVSRIVTAAGEMVFDRARRAFFAQGARQDPDGNAALAKTLGNAALCNNATLGEDGADNVGDPMEVALLEAAEAAGFRRPELVANGPELAEHAFDSKTLMMATVHQNGDGDGVAIAVKGAPEAVFAHVRSVLGADGLTPFDGETSRHWSDLCARLAARGLRLLAVAGKRAETADAAPYDDLELYGVVALEDPPRGDIRQALAEARGAGIKVIMVTGDHDETARAISDQVGLAPEASPSLGGHDLRPLSALSEQERVDLRQVRIFSRVTPEQKLDLINLHQEAGEVVAMTGDGVNDAPALKKADIGIAMGQRGTQVAREAADMVLRDDAFSSIVHAIREGRTIYANIRRFTTYLLSCNLSEILVVGLAVTAGLPLPLLPLQILFLNLVTDVFPAFALGTIAGGRNVLARAPRPPGEPILAARQWRAIIAHGLTIAAAVLVALWLGLNAFGLDGDQVTTMSFFTLALAQLWHTFDMRNWREGLIVNAVSRNPFIWGAILLCLALLGAALFVPPLASALNLTMLPANAWAATFALSLSPVVLRTLSALWTRWRRADWSVAA